MTELGKRIDEILDQEFINFFGYLYHRWQDEKEYEDFQEYKDIMETKLLNKGVRLEAMSKSPFEMRFSIAGKKIRCWATSRCVNWKQLS